MNTATRLGAYAAGLAVVFGGAFVAADAAVPSSTVNNWTNEAKGHDMNNITGSHSEHSASGSPGTNAAVPGVTSAHGGYLLSPITAPGAVDQSGTLSFRIFDMDGNVVTRFAISHEKELHLIVVRSDGTQFRHVHPTMDTDGTWSLPWDWAAAGTYRVYTDFASDANGAADAITLTNTVEVAGQFTPVTSAPTKDATVGGYTVKLTGDAVAGSSSKLTFAVSKDGKPVVNLEPYLGAFGHLVALREGDLAFLHVHPEGDEPMVNEESGPEIGFLAEMPTPGRYLLYLDFQVNGKVHSAPLVVDTTGTANTEPGHADSTHADNESQSGTEADRHNEPDASHDH
ncbi:heavy-metal-associated domain-containing protein [Demequina sp. SO4-13]|uniref:heavy-metal-associated domain-containing protein n=1 Tax=Demequina sp. SO4-13 TaxID=3401027 RepID=UPI003AF65F1F